MDTPLVWHLILRSIHAWFTAKMGGEVWENERSNGLDSGHG